MIQHPVLDRSHLLCSPWDIKSPCVMNYIWWSKCCVVTRMDLKSCEVKACRKCNTSWRRTGKRDLLTREDWFSGRCDRQYDCLRQNEATWYTDEEHAVCLCTRNCFWRKKSFSWEKAHAKKKLLLRKSSCWEKAPPEKNSLEVIKGDTVRRQPFSYRSVQVPQPLGTG